MLAVSAGYRSDRVRSWLDPSADAQGAGYQARQAKFALANGGVFGEGLGQGTAKWNYLPNAHNDFIFAIVGEELGLVGAVGLLALFGLFAYTGMRIARRSADPFLRLLTAAATMWVIGQSFINVGYVIGLLPVTGIQLPLISAGGTSTATTLFMIGVVANAARHEPDAVAALRAGRDDRMNRWLRLPLPEPYVPTRVEALRDRLAHPRRRAPAKAPKKGKPARKARPGAGGSRHRATPPARASASWRRPPHGTRRAAPSTPAASTGRSALRVNNSSVTQPAGGQEQSDRGRRATALPSRWSSPVAARPAMSSRPWRWPMRSAPWHPGCGSPHWAPRAAWRPGWSPNAATTCG